MESLGAKCIAVRDEKTNELIAIAGIDELPSAQPSNGACWGCQCEKMEKLQPESCDGCKWEYAFGFGECHHCKRSFNDMYERGEQDE